MERGKKMLEDLFTEIENLHTFQLADNPFEIDEWGASYRFVPVIEIKVTGYDIYGDSANPADFLWPKSWFTVCDVLDGNYISVEPRHQSPVSNL